MKYGDLKLHPSITHAWKLRSQSVIPLWNRVWKAYKTMLLDFNCPSPCKIAFACFHIMTLLNFDFLMKSNAPRPRTAYAHSKSAWHFIIRHLVQRQTVDEIWISETSSAHNACMQAPVTKCYTITESRGEGLQVHAFGFQTPFFIQKWYWKISCYGPFKFDLYY